MSGRIPAPGEDLGPYRITRIIGRGGMGVVVGAIHRGLEREIALKVLPPEVADDPEYRARFLSEARVLARLDSPHVVTIHDVGEIDGCLYLAMKLVVGDLTSRIRVFGPLEVPAALDLLRQIAEGLRAAHEAGVLHRDIKTSNVLLREGSTLHAYLCDFGIAQVEDVQLTRTGAVAGTWAYLAPERHDGEPATTATDVYALGCLLWAMLTGAAPYPGATEWQIALAHRTQEIPQLDAGDARTVAVNALLRALLAKRPDDRISTAAEVVERVETILAGSGSGSGSASGSGATTATTALAPGAPGASRAPSVDPPEERPVDPAAATVVDASAQRTNLASPDARSTPTAPTALSGPSGPSGPSVSVAPSAGAPGTGPDPRGKSPARRRGALVVAAVLALVIAIGVTIALLRDRGEPSPSGETAVQGPSYVTVEAGTYGDLRTQYGSLPVEYAGPAWAFENGYFDDAGFAEVVGQEPSADAVELLGSGAVDIGFVSALTAARAIADGAPITVVATTFQTSPIAVLSLSDAADIRTPADLIGKRVGVQSGNAPLFDHLLAINDIDRDDVEIVASDLETEPLVAGDLDAMVGFAASQAPALEAAGHEVTTMTYASAGFAFPTLAVAVGRDYLQENRDAVEAYLVAVIRGWGEALRAPDEETLAVVDEQIGATPDDRDPQVDNGLRQQIALRIVRDLVRPTAAGDGLLSISEEKQTQVVTAAQVAGSTVAAADVFDASLLADLYAEYPELLDLPR